MEINKFKKYLAKNIEKNKSSLNIDYLLDDNFKFFYDSEMLDIKVKLLDLWYEANENILDEYFAITSMDRECDFNEEDEIAKIYDFWLDVKFREYLLVLFDEVRKKENVS